VLGCGGSARAVVAGLVERNLEVIELAAPRRPSGAQPPLNLPGLGPPNCAANGDQRALLLAALCRPDLVVTHHPGGHGR